MKTTTTSLEEVLRCLYVGRGVQEEYRSEPDVWYCAKPNNQIALNVYETITGKTTTNFIWLKLDREILSSWINALEAISE
jgi:hypothetical protein